MHIVDVERCLGNRMIVTEGLQESCSEVEKQIHVLHRGGWAQSRSEGGQREGLEDGLHGALPT